MVGDKVVHTKHNTCDVHSSCQRRCMQASALAPAVSSRIQVQH
jgi:hypothetical protein